MAKENTTLPDQELRLRVLDMAVSLAHCQHNSKLTDDAEKNSKVENVILQDTLRNAKRLWKFVKEDPLAEKEES